MEVLRTDEGTTYIHTCMYVVEGHICRRLIVAILLFIKSDKPASHRMYTGQPWRETDVEGYEGKMKELLAALRSLG